MRVFDDYGGTPGTREFVCEVEGAGTGWSDPFWVMERERRKTEVLEQTHNRVNEDGSFLRWTRISLLENSTSEVLCMSSHDSKGAIQMSVMNDGRLLLSGHSLCLELGLDYFENNL